jgi:copper chaperone CopZ
VRLASLRSGLLGCGAALLLAGCRREAVLVEAPVPVPVTAPAPAPVTLRLAVEGMMCQEACGGLVRRALEKVPGVTKVEVSHERKEAVVTGERLDPAALAAAVNAVDGGGRFQASTGPSR